MYSNYYHMPYGYPYVTTPYLEHPYSRYPYPHYFQHSQMHYDTRQPVRGQATWTEGGAVTQCGIPWSKNNFMTVAVGGNSPYQCGQTIKIKNVSNQKAVLVTVVDKVTNYPANRVNLHRKAFEALGANVETGVINVEIIGSPELEEEKWGKYLLEIVLSANPNYKVTDYSKVSKTQQAGNKTREVYKFVLKSPQETINIQGTVVYNPDTDKINSINFKEV
ncbi:RlpA-like double-psi beta-barrel domain-containing protein [Halobacillus sp. BBL2006]|uniref:RlpA-like double-psi beta-barrel domain-containing protein n=1 Tax=Halobacillus sp. BBL2006 TaxID=1543706 RepID=UPI00054269F2|nr:RlpA-like double-psi beta-barrel domain-containing protein [Halobacillus sp. BBL2006]KHE67923.1 hypothetical protein LD39_15670 [Halobacillus sp. BBL2006]